MMLVTCLLITFAFQLHDQQSLELEYLKLAKKYFKFEFGGFENIDNLNSKGQCCANVNATVCTPCSTFLRVFRYESSGNVSFFSSPSSSNRSRDSFYFTRTLIVNPDEYLSFQVNQLVVQNNDLIDVWENFNSTLVGTFTMNGVWGQYGNSLLYYVLEITSLESYSSYFTVVFHIIQLTWLKREYSDGTCCNPTTINETTVCINSCPFIINIYANDSYAHTSGVSGYTGNLTSYYVKAASGSTSRILRGDYLRLKLSIVGSNSSILIDELTIPSVRVLPNRVAEFTNLVGNFGKLRLDFSVRYECRGYSGMNCQHFCDENTRFIECHHLTGRKFCGNGAINMPDCNQFNNTCADDPCVNGGRCVQLPSAFVCKCPKGYKGKYCEEPNCDSECKRGVCNNNKCVCDPTFEGDFCDMTACPDSLAGLCRNGGTCKIINNETKCLCTQFATGPTCEEPVCLTQCQVGSCSFVDGSLPVRSACSCANGFSGDSCDVRPLKSVFGYETLYIVLISIFATLLVLLLKTFMVMVLVKFDPEQKPGLSSTNDAKERTKSLGAL